MGEYGSDLDKEPGGDEGQAAVLTVEAVVIGVEGEVVQIEEPEKYKDSCSHLRKQRATHLEFICRISGLSGEKNWNISVQT